MNNVLCPSYLRDSQPPRQRTGGISESKLSRPTISSKVLTPGRCRWTWWTRNWV